MSTNDPNYLNSLLPRRKSLAPILIPLTLLILVVIAGVWALKTYVYPVYNEAEQQVQASQEMLNSLEGHTVTEKKQEGECYKLSLLDPEGKTVKHACVPEPVWSVNTAGEKYVPVDLKEISKEDLTIPWLPNP